jgi:hypothetical protein
MNTTEAGNKLRDNVWVKNILLALGVAVIGFVLLNITFFFYALIFRFISLLASGDPESLPAWFPMVRHIIASAVILLMSWGVLRTKLPVLVKASVLTVPTAVILVLIGILLYQQPVLPYLAGGLLVIITLAYLARTHRHWLYYYSVILVSLALAVFTLAGGEI